MKLSNRVYDALKWICTIFLPACSAFYFGLCKIWNFPYGTEVCGTLALVSVFIGTLIGISSANYWKEPKDA